MLTFPVSTLAFAYLFAPPVGVDVLHHRIEIRLAVAQNVALLKTLKHVKIFNE